MTDSDTTPEAGTAAGGVRGDSLEAAAEQGPLPGIEQADKAEREGRDNSTMADAPDAGETAAAAGGVILGGISQSR